MRERHRKGLSKLGGRDVTFDAPLRLYTTFRVGGNAACFFRARTLGYLERLAAFLGGEGIPWMVLGKGSNLLVGDGGFDGVVVRLRGELAEVSAAAGDRLSAGGGLANRRLLEFCMREGVGGLEYLAGIPGTAGGAVAMNAGAFGTTTGGTVERIEVLDAEGGIHWKSAEDMGFAYRESRIPSGAIVLSVHFKVRKESPGKVASTIAGNLEKRRRSQPRGLPSAGSVFKNPKGDFAGRLLEAAGLKGKRIGGAEISPVNANWIVNTGGATASDILRLMDAAREAVLRSSGIELEPEVRTLGV